MKTNTDMLNLLFPVVHTTTLTTLLGTGKVYRWKKPVNSVLNDVVLTPLNISNGLDINVQPGTVIINIYSKKQVDGTYPETLLRSISALVISAIEAYVSSTTFLTMEIVSDNIMDDMDNTSMCYESIRINFWIES